MTNGELRFLIVTPTTYSDDLRQSRLRLQERFALYLPGQSQMADERDGVGESVGPELAVR